MSTFQVVKKQVDNLPDLTRKELLVMEAAGLVSTGESLSEEEKFLRLDLAFRVLQGEDVPELSAAIATVRSLKLAKDMVDSYLFNEDTGFSTFTVPAGVTDVEAMKALNQHFRKYLPQFNRDAVWAGDLEWYGNLPTNYPDGCAPREYKESRQITILGVVGESPQRRFDVQAWALRRGSLDFSDPRDQAIAAALHACKHGGQDLFKGLWMRGSVYGKGMYTNRDKGVTVSNPHKLITWRAASGSPYPKSKS